VQMLKKGHHGVELDAEAWDRLYTWIDLNVPDHGTWSEHRLIAGNFHQRRIEMRTRYANRPEDPEIIPENQRDPVEPIMPKKPRTAQLASAPKVEGWPFGKDEAAKRQSAAGSETRRTIDLGEGVTMDLVLVPAGEFVMGSAKGFADERPQSPVNVSKPFWMGVGEVTNAQFQRFQADHDNGFINQQHKDHTTPGYSMQAADMPAMRLSWDQAVAFTQWVSKKAGIKCALPTEAQWEWACRAGTATPFFYGDTDSDFSRYANLADISIQRLAVSGVNPRPIKNPDKNLDWMPQDDRFNDENTLMTKAGQYEANPWGLKDMHGNVWEWTRSEFRAYPYRDDDGRNDLAAQSQKVVRGGSWIDRPKRAHSAVRVAYEPWQSVWNVGFRIAVEADAKTALVAGE
jgi:formylglycine-generating enzyme required for sulfatase activity